MRIPDYHIHSNYSPDASMWQKDAAEAAIKAGITDLCFTEHMDLGHHMDMYNKVPDLKEMYDSIQKMQELYPDISIGFGLEAGYMKETAEETVQVIQSQKFDYVLLSTHCVDGLDCGRPESKRGREKAEAYRRYLETVYESVTDNRLANAYDCVGHLGYIAKGRHYEDNVFTYEMFPQLFDEILLKIIKNEKGIEVNTSGLQSSGYVLPHPSVISRYYELGGRIITTGSDAHRPEQVGANIRSTLELIRRGGLKEIAVFNQRKPYFLEIK